MNLLKKIKSIKGFKVFLISFFLFLLLFIIFDCAVTLISFMKANAIGALQANLYATFKKDIDKHIDTIPDYLSPVSAGKGEYYLKREFTYYYPDAWSKPGHILLKRKVGNFYYVTFGDGTKSIVAYRSYQGNDESMKVGYISPTHGCKYMFGNFWFIPLGAITIAITLFLTEREEKRKKVES